MTDQQAKEKIERFWERYAAVRVGDLLRYDAPDSEGEVVSRQAAEQMIRDFHEHYPELVKWSRAQRQTAKER